MILTKHHFVFFVYLICTCVILDAFANPRGDENNLGKSTKKSNDTTAKNHSAKKSPLFRLTAARLIGGIIFVILTGLFIYYFFIFYPILCKKERNYDVVEHSRETTPSPNTEKSERNE